MQRRWLALGLWLSLLPSAFACDCSELSDHPCASIKDASAVFLGTVIAVDNPPSDDPKADSSGTSWYTFRVEEAFSGVNGERVEVFSGRGGADCSYHFKAGASYLVFAYKDSDGDLSTSVCSGTRSKEYAAAALDVLRAQRDGKHLPTIAGLLRRQQQPYTGTYLEAYDGGLAHHTVRITGSDGKTFTSASGDQGQFAF